MKAKKMIALFISTVLTIGTLAGCSSSGNGSSDGKSASSGSGKIELEFFTQKRRQNTSFSCVLAPAAGRLSLLFQNLMQARKKLW